MSSVKNFTQLSLPLMEQNDPVALEKALNENAQEGVKYRVKPLPGGHMRIISAKVP